VFAAKDSICTATISVASAIAVCTSSYGQRRSLGDDRLADVQGLLVQPDRGAVGDLDEHVLSHSVHDRDARLEQQLAAGGWDSAR